VRDYYDEECGEEYIDEYIEWIEDLDFLTINWKEVPVSRDGDLYHVGDLFVLEDTIGYCGGILVTMKEATEENMGEFVTFLFEKTPYSQLLCGDVTNKIFLSLGAIDLGGFLLLEVK